MHGLIHTELASYIKQQQGIKLWQSIMQKAELTDRLYLQVGSYPDEEIQAIVAAAAELTGKSVDDLLEDFGFYLVPRLIESYRSYVDPQWKTLQFLLNTEQTIHRVVRLKDKFAAPPRLKFTQTGENSLLLEYDSPRRMQAVARGMIKGVADWYGERVRLKETISASGVCRLEIAIQKMGA
jgi:heme-NO-binding protein